MPSDRASRREFLRSAGLLGGAVFVASCAPAAAPAPSAAPSAPGSPSPGAPKVSPPRTAKVAAPHFNSLVSLVPWIVADKKAFFRDVGLAHEITGFAGGGDTVRGLLQGGNNYGQAAAPAIVPAALQGQPIRIVAGGFGANTISVIAKKGSGIRSVRDLSGRKVGFSNPGSSSQFVITRTLKDAGVAAQLVSVGGALESLTALRNNVVDSTWTVVPTPQRYASEFDVVFNAFDTVAKYPEHMLCVEQKFAEQNPEVVRAWLYAYGQALEYVKANPEESATLWAQVSDQPVDATIAGVRSLAKGVWELKLDLDALKLIEEGMLDAKQVNAPIDWKKVVVQDYLPPDKRIALP